MIGWLVGGQVGPAAISVVVLIFTLIYFEELGAPRPLRAYVYLFLVSIAAVAYVGVMGTVFELDAFTRRAASLGVLAATVLTMLSWKLKFRLRPALGWSALVSLLFIAASFYEDYARIAVFVLGFAFLLIGPYDAWQKWCDRKGRTVFDLGLDFEYMFPWTSYNDEEAEQTLLSLLAAAGLFALGWLIA